MGRSPCCAKEGLNRGAWTALEDKTLVSYINANGAGCWGKLPKRAGLKRCGKSCRLRWLNYLRPDIKLGNISHDEEELIIRLHNLLGNRWSLIAGRLPGRTDNEIKNYWNTTLAKRLAQSSTTSASSPPPHTPPSGAKTKKGLSPHSPPPMATRPRVTRAKPIKSFYPPPDHFSPPSLPVPNDNLTQFPALLPLVPHAQGTALLPARVHDLTEVVRDGCIGDLGFLESGFENFEDESPDGLITIDDKMLEDWAKTYDSTASFEEGKDMWELESLPFLLEEWP